MKKPAPDLVCLDEAGDWLARLRAPDRTEADEAAFRAWLIASPQNALAFEAVNAMWDDVGALSHELRNQNAAAPRRIPSRRAAMLGSLGLLVTVGGGFAFLRNAEAEVYRTDVGEQKHVTLRDGSEVFLDTDTELIADVTKKNRLVKLEYGRANFRVAADGYRAFAVQAADNLIVGNKSSFDVRRDGDETSIVLISGTAMIQSEVDNAKQLRSLSGGQRLTVTADQSAKLDKPNLLTLLAWHTGQAVFENCPLSSAIREMNRYSTVALEIDDTRVAKMKISGVFRVGDNADFARALSHFLPISVRADSDRIELVVDEGRLGEG